MVYRIKELRQQKGVTQKELSKYLGVAQNTLSYWENGKIDIDTESLCKLADYFQISLDFLLGRENTQQRGSDPIRLTSHEKDLIHAYREKKSMQPAVDRLLDLPPDDAETAAYIAARGQNAGGATVQLNKEEIEKLRSVKESDEDF